MACMRSTQGIDACGRGDMHAGQHAVHEIPSLAKCEHLGYIDWCQMERAHVSEGHAVASGQLHGRDSHARTWAFILSDHRTAHVHVWPSIWVAMRHACMHSAISISYLNMQSSVDRHSSCNESEAAKPAREVTDMQSSDRTQARARLGEATSPLIDKPHAARCCTWPRPGGHVMHLDRSACSLAFKLGKLEINRVQVSFSPPGAACI
jgi:hypothetical protein